MLPIKKVLFPIDFSEVSSRIAPWVKDVGKRFEAEIHLLFVVPSLEQYAGLFVPEVSIENFEGEVTLGGESSMEKFVSDHFADFPECRTRIEVGDAARKILQYIDSEGIDLVIMGRGGRKGVEKFLFGSVAEKVIKSSPAPVLTVQ
jgi:nucleotide-binding universal stress UspA family protein